MTTDVAQPRVKPRYTSTGVFTGVTIRGQRYTLLELELLHSDVQVILRVLTEVRRQRDMARAESAVLRANSFSPATANARADEGK
jgi:hypothetical protein